ncbi:MAG: hypothetical protein ACYC5G_00415 [Candidatus Doudnabacteria bacterium]
MRKISLLLSASLFLAACGGEVGGITDPVIKTCSGSISPSSQVTISAGQTTSVKLQFSNCSSVTVTSDNDVKYQSGVNVAPDTTLQLWPSKATVYTFVGNGEGAQPTVRLTVNVVGKPELSIDVSAVPDSGVVLNSTVTLPLRKQNINSCNVISFSETPSTADPKTVKATATISGESLVYSPGSTMPVLVNGKRQATITVSCQGQDNSFVTAVTTIKLSVPTLKCSSITPDSVSSAWQGDVVVNCTGNSVTSLNGVDFKGTMTSLSFGNFAAGAPSGESFITNPGQFQDPNHFAGGILRIGPVPTYPIDAGLWYKNSERSEVPLLFILRFRP